MVGRPVGPTEDIHIEWRIVTCYHAKHLSGDFVECGSNTGIMSIAICDYIDFRPTEVNIIVGDATKARIKLRWSPKHSLVDLVRDMFAADLELFKRERLLEDAAHKVLPRHER